MNEPLKYNGWGMICAKDIQRLLHIFFVMTETAREAASKVASKVASEAASERPRGH